MYRKVEECRIILKNLVMKCIGKVEECIIILNNLIMKCIGQVECRITLK